MYLPNLLKSKLFKKYIYFLDLKEWDFLMIYRDQRSRIYISWAYLLIQSVDYPYHREYTQTLLTFSVSIHD